MKQDLLYSQHQNFSTFKFKQKNLNFSFFLFFQTLFSRLSSTASTSSTQGSILSGDRLVNNNNHNLNNLFNSNFHPQVNLSHSLHPKQEVFLGVHRVETFKMFDSETVQLCHKTNNLDLPLNNNSFHLLLHHNSLCNNNHHSKDRYKVCQG